MKTFLIITILSLIFSCGEDSPRPETSNNTVTTNLEFTLVAIGDNSISGLLSDYPRLPSGEELMWEHRFGQTTNPALSWTDSVSGGGRDFINGLPRLLFDANTGIYPEFLSGGGKLSVINKGRNALSAEFFDSELSLEDLGPIRNQIDLVSLSIGLSDFCRQRAPNDFKTDLKNSLTSIIELLSSDSKKLSLYLTTVPSFYGHLKQSMSGEQTTFIDESDNQVTITCQEFWDTYLTNTQQTECARLFAPTDETGQLQLLNDLQAFNSVYSEVAGELENDRVKFFIHNPTEEIGINDFAADCFHLSRRGQEKTAGSAFNFLKNNGFSFERYESAPISQ